MIKPPTEDTELRRKSVVAVDAVVSSAMRGIAKGFGYTLAAVVLFGIGVRILPHLHKPPEWEQSILDWINRTEDSWTNRAAYSPSNADEAIRKQNDIALAKIHSGQSPSPAKTTRR